jgi:hypothetical protein
MGEKKKEEKEEMEEKKKEEKEEKNKRNKKNKQKKFGGEIRRRRKAMQKHKIMREKALPQHPPLLLSSCSLLFVLSSHPSSLLMSLLQIGPGRWRRGADYAKTLFCLQPRQISRFGQN